MKYLPHIIAVWMFLIGAAAAASYQQQVDNALLTGSADFSHLTNTAQVLAQLGGGTVGSGSSSVPGLSFMLIGAQLQLSGTPTLSTGTGNFTLLKVGGTNVMTLFAPAGNYFPSTGTLPGTQVSGTVPAAASVPWTGVTSRPTSLSQFTNDLTISYGSLTGAPTNLSQFENGPGYIVASGSYDGLYAGRSGSAAQADYSHTSGTASAINANDTTIINAGRAMFSGTSAWTWMDYGGSVYITATGGGHGLMISSSGANGVAIIAKSDSGASGLKVIQDHNATSSAMAVVRPLDGDPHLSGIPSGSGSAALLTLMQAASLAAPILEINPYNTIGHIRVENDGRTMGLGLYPEVVTDTTYTVQQKDNGKMKVFPNGCTVTVPSGLSYGFNVGLMQSGATVVTVAGATGVTVAGRNGLSTAGTLAVMMVWNYGTANTYDTTGDTTP